MTLLTEPRSSFDVLTGPSADELLTAAAAATTRAADDPTHGVLVIVVRPDADDHQVISGGGTGVLRAAVSVAVGAGNDRMWRDAPVGTTSELATRALPEVIASAADAGGVRAAHVGVVRHDDAAPIDAVAIWFETWNGVARADDRRTALELLGIAAANEAARRAALPDESASSAVDELPAGRTFDPDDPAVDAVTGTLTADAFEELLFEFEGEEATVVIVDVDDFDAVLADGPECGDRVLRELADRLVANCRKDDAIARLGRERFAVLLGDFERSAALQLAKRLLAEIAEPLPVDVGFGAVSATIALAHESGLVDLEELLESAVAAVSSAKRDGAGRLVLAA